VALSFGTITLLVLLERALLFAAEIRFARRSPSPNRVLIVGTDDVAAHLKRAIEGEPRLRSRVLGFVGTATAAPDPDIPLALVLGPLSSLDHIVGSQRVDQIILTDSTLDYRRLVELVLLCERNLITFNVVPDLFRLMTTRVDVRTVDGIPLLGVSAMPLDGFWNRFWKRAEDLAGASVGLVLAAPVIAFAALLIKRTSPGPVFYRQERCGEDGHRFTLYKLRTMREDAERDTGPVWTTENDPRRTPAGAWLRRLGLDELPQLWNVLRGDMSLVGPRPERPHFVEQFREDISRYMWRHVSRPGITGWAQVNGLRGNTGIEERIKYDLYYLENWSLALDVKILLRTLFSRRNAY
jgi:exopolysaccharide biosynthesis polyprenyl glycosylphosphotransferase